MERKIKVEMSGQAMQIVVGEAELVGPADGETTWQLADVDVYLVAADGELLAGMPFRAGAYLDGTDRDGVWSQDQDGARALVSLFTGLPIEPKAQYGLPMVRACGTTCAAIGAAISAAIREAAEGAE